MCWQLHGETKTMGEWDFVCLSAEQLQRSSRQHTQDLSNGHSLSDSPEDLQGIKLVSLMAFMSCFYGQTIREWQARAFHTSN